MPKSRKIQIGDEVKIVAMFKGMRTMQEIGDSFGVSRERIRQILSGMGVESKDGGSRKNASINRVEKAKKREQMLDRKAKRLGMSRAEFDSHIAEYGLGNGSPRKAFASQRNSAKRRGIEWKFTFGEWWRYWQKSGKWNERGRQGYVMGRNGDSGPYSADNVYICTSKQNGFDCTVNKPWTERKFKKGHAGKRLTVDDVLNIRAMQGMTHAEMAIKFNVDESTISNVINRKTWKGI